MFVNIYFDIFDIYLVLLYLCIYKYITNNYKDIKYNVSNDIIQK